MLIYYFSYISYFAGYTFTDWINEKANACDKCCGGEVSQTRTCQSIRGQCTAQLKTRTIKCKHVCKDVKCSGDDDDDDADDA
jgi:hypothetical protein